MPVENAESTPANETPREGGTQEAQREPLPLEDYTPEQHTEWLKTGKTVTVPAKTKTEESSPSPSPGQAPAEPQKKAETPAESDPEGKEEEQEPERRPAEKRIKQLTARSKELEAQNRAMAERLAALERPAERQQQPPEPKAAERPKRPKIDEFENFDQYESALDKYEEDLADWKARERYEAERRGWIEQEQKRQFESQQAELNAKFQKSAASAAERHPDFAEVTKDKQVRINPGMFDFIRSSDLGGDLFYHLAKNPSEAERIFFLDPPSTFREMAKLELSLSKPEQQSKAPAPKQVSAAKPPPTTVSGTNRTPEDELAAAMAANDQEAYNRIMNARDIAAARR